MMSVQFDRPVQNSFWEKVISHLQNGRFSSADIRLVNDQSTQHMQRLIGIDGPAGVSGFVNVYKFHVNSVGVILKSCIQILRG